MELRKLTVHDREIITELFRDVFTNEPWNDDWSDPAQLDAYITDLTGQGYSLTLGYFDGGRLVALSMGHVKHWYTGTEYFIDELCVARGMQGKGIGGRFLEAVEAYLSENGICQMFLQTENNVPAYRFYLKNGFSELAGHVSFSKRIPDSRRNGTLDWYRENLESFISGTADADMTEQYRLFLEHVPSGGRVLDLGCGAGSASLYFTRAGYDVLAADGCPELCEYTRGRAGCPVRCLRFEELDYTDEFDGVWACASLLHVRKTGLPPVLRLVRRALKKGGVFYASFKHGEAERESNGRVFSDFTEESLRTLLVETGGFREIALWTTGDVRPDRAGERWVNVLCRAE